MSQHDLDIANQGFPATRALLNLALKALGSLQVWGNRAVHDLCQYALV